MDWSDDELRSSLKEFAELYEHRPISNNARGMKAPHLFSTWFCLKRMQPAVVVESGVWLGQGTWMIEQACPTAKIICIEPVLRRIRYRSSRAEYYSEDFSKRRWEELPREGTLLFFDDHSNAKERIKTMVALGFRHAMFEDNYPSSQGDCLSLKKILMASGYPISHTATPSALSRARAALHPNVECYYEFPPVFQTQRTRWGDPWTNEHYPGPSPLLETVTEPYQEVFLEEAKDYTWLCYLKL